MAGSLAIEASPGDGGTGIGPPQRSASAAFLPRLGIWVAVLAIVVGLDPDPALSLMVVALAGVVTIVSDARFGIERRAEALGIPSREAWVPLMMLVVLFGLDLVDADRIGPVIREQGPVIVFILAFALVSEGLGRSGFFHFLAYRLAERGGADTTRLLLYLFLLSSLLTYLTSNDIVVLTMTPIVLSVVYQARIKNAKLLLLSQFVAANTVSMGLLIGSPTNLIVGRAVGMGFVEYFLLMLVPSVMALMGTFVVVTWINGYVERLGIEKEAPRSRLALRLAERRRRQGRLARGASRAGRRLANKLAGTWKFSSFYSTPRFAEYRSFTAEMGRWIVVFAVAIVLLALGAGTSSGLLLAAVTIGVLGTTFLRRNAARQGEPTGVRFAGRLFKVLPVGIVFFGMTYFFIADAIANEPFVENEVEDVVAEAGSTHTPLSSWFSILGAGALVNTMNDLPASALSGEVLAGVDERDSADVAADGEPVEAGFDTPFDRILVAQGLLVGLNIGTYVTPVGALAGIIWFDILRRERDRRHRLALERGVEPLSVIMPERRDLIVYGVTNFLAMAFLLGATNFGFVALADWLAGPPSGHTRFGEAPAHFALSIACLALAGTAVFMFFRVLRKHGVALTHLADLLFLWTRVRLRAARHRLVTATMVFALIFAVSAALLYNIETFHAAHYSADGQWGGTQPLDFEGPIEFVLWLHVFITSGYEANDFPDSVFGRLIAPVLVLGAIASVVFVVRTLLTGSSDERVRQRIATGEIPGERLVIVNADVENVRLIEMLGNQPRRFVTIATRSGQLRRWIDDQASDRMAPFAYGDPARGGDREFDVDLVTALRLHEAREIVLLSRSLSDDFANIDLLTTLDAVLGRDDDLAAGQPEAFDRPELPAILLQRHGIQISDLVTNRISTRLRRSMVDLGFDEAVRTFLAANTAGRLEDVREIYARSFVGEDTDVDRHVEIHGLQLALSVDREHAGELRPPTGTGVVVGVEVLTAARPDWRTFAARRAREVERQVTGTVLLGRLGPSDAPFENSARAGVYVVGGDGLAQQCATDLVASGVERVTLLVGPGDTLIPGMSRVSGLDVRRCADEVAAVESLLASDHGNGDEAILVVESLAEGAFDVEKLLERLSLERLERARSEPERVTPLYVCCRGPERARRIRNYVVDEIIDATWVDASYFAVFTALYLNTMAEHEMLANWPQERRLRVADHIAHRLYHLELVRPSEAWAEEPAASDKNAVGMTGPEAVQEDQAIGPARGPLVGVIRFDVTIRDGDEPVVTVNVDVPASDERIEPDDLLVCLPCL